MKQIKACVFNVYGTLLDTYLPFLKYRDQLGENALGIYKLWRSKRLQYSSQLSLMDRYTDYEKIRRYALDFACDVHGMDDEQVKNNILEAHTQLDCYADTEEALATFKKNGIIAAALSNGTPQVLSSTLKRANIDHLLDSVFSTGQIHAYKPSPAVYEFVEEQLALPRNQISFVSSNSWDIAGAVSYGFYSIWINRYGRTPECLPYKADLEFTSLSEVYAGLPK